MTTVLIRGMLTSWTGYGQIAEWLGRGLEAEGCTVVYDDYHSDGRWQPRRGFVLDRLNRQKTEEGVDHLVHLAIPNMPFECSIPTTYFTMWEADGIPTTSYVNKAKRVVVPSEFNAVNFRRVGVTAPIHVCPLGVSSAEGYTPWSIPVDGPTIFGMAAQLHDGANRKGITEGIAAFLDAFPEGTEDVRLRIKLWPGDIVKLWLRNDDPRIDVSDEPLYPPQMAQWTKGVTALLVPSKCEGWGLHTLQAMACGRPVIAAKYSGTADFFDGRFGWEVDYDVVPATGIYAGTGNWCVPCHESMVAALRDAHGCRSACIARGSRAAKRAAEFTWERTARRLMEILDS